MSITGTPTNISTPASTTVSTTNTNSTHVVVSRIQNRRGTQADFNGFAYSTSGPNSVYPYNSTGNGYYPSSTDINFTAANYPNVLLPGELSLCTDSGRIFMGNLNGGYTEISQIISAGGGSSSNSSGDTLQPSSWPLPPASTFTTITRVVPNSLPVLNIPLDWSSTPFFIINYSITDNGSADWTTVGNSFSRNGQLKITAINSSAMPVPPSTQSTNPAPQSPVSLVDTGVEINATPGYDISFNAYYSAGRIHLSYIHNFPTTIILNTETTNWVTF